MVLNNSPFKIASTDGPRHEGDQSGPDNRSLNNGTTNDTRVNNQESLRSSTGGTYRAVTPPQQAQPQQAQTQPAPNQHAQSTSQPQDAHFQQTASQIQPQDNSDMRQFPSLMQLSEQQLYKYRERMMGSPGLIPPYHRVSPTGIYLDYQGHLIPLLLCRVLHLWIDLVSWKP